VPQNVRVCAAFCVCSQSARAVVSQARHRDDPVSRWVTEIAQRSHTNVAAVALANKTARIAWAMLRQGTDYTPQLAVT